jgi:hypothetical protein
MHTKDELRIVKKIAGLMKVPDSVQMYIVQSANINPARSETSWKCLSLSDGFPGLLLLFATLDSSYPEENWDQQTSEG